MAQQEEGWPLGLHPVNVRVGLARNLHYPGSISFNTTLTASPSCSTDSSSDLDTESTGSFFHDTSITLGSLIGVSSILELSRRSIRGRKTELSKEKKATNTTTTTNNKSKFWLFSLCSRDSTDAECMDMNNNPPSLGHFLAVERRAANECGRNHISSPTIFGPDELALVQPDTEPNSLFINGCVAPPQSGSCHAADSDSRMNNTPGLKKVLDLFSCMCAQPSH